MSDSYYHIAAPLLHEVRIKRSRFIGLLEPVADREAAEARLEAIRAERHDATHNCFAWRITPDESRFSDDGEPSGTAGRPILAMLEKYALQRALLVVTRYFGGVKLGTGGLIRAYSLCAEETIERAVLKKVIPHHVFFLRYPYTLTRQIDYLVSRHHGRLVDPEFAADVRARAEIPVDSSDAFHRELVAAGGGQVHIGEDGW